MSQTYKGKLIVVGYGSSRENVKWERKLFGKQLVVANNPHKEFCISHANNIGIAKAKTKYVMTCGIDMIFSNNLFETYVSSCEKNALALPGCSPTFLDVAGKVTTTKDRPCCLCFHRSWLNKVGGYNEMYEGWGYEDDDIRRRAMAFGYSLVNVSGECQIYHQHHPVIHNEELVKKNRKLFELQ